MNQNKQENTSNLSNTLQQQNPSGPLSTTVPANTNDAATQVPTNKGNARRNEFDSRDSRFSRRPINNRRNNIKRRAAEKRDRFQSDGKGKPFSILKRNHIEKE
jgi:hypothetical protein